METLKAPEIHRMQPVQEDFNADALRMVLEQCKDAVRNKGVLRVDSALLYISWQVLPEVMKKYPEISNSNWYHELIGSTPIDRQGCDQDAEAYEETRRLFTELPERIERGDFDDILQTFLVRKKITSLFG